MWYAFFFAPESPIVVCVFRIAFALLLLVFISLTSLDQRNPFVLHSGDTILRLFSLLLAFAPVGAMLSVDAWVSGTVASDSPPWALRLMQVLMATIYLRSLGWKLPGRWWREGSAVYWALTAAGSTESGRCRRLRATPCTWANCSLSSASRFSWSVIDSTMESTDGSLSLPSRASFSADSPSSWRVCYGPTRLTPVGLTRNASDGRRLAVSKVPVRKVPVIWTVPSTWTVRPLLTWTGTRLRSGSTSDQHWSTDLHHHHVTASSCGTLDAEDSSICHM